MLVTQITFKVLETQIITLEVLKTQITFKVLETQIITLEVLIAAP